jgi:hypothetical protein
MTDFRALCAELLEWAERTSSHYFIQADVVVRARAALAEDPVGPTLMERALAGDATAAKQFLHEAGFTDKHGQWLPQYQSTPEATNA